MRTSAKATTEQKPMCHMVSVMGKWKPHTVNIHLLYRMTPAEETILGGEAR